MFILNLLNMKNKQPRVSQDGLLRKPKYKVGEFVRYIYNWWCGRWGTILKIERKKPTFGKSYYIYYIHDRLETINQYNSLYKVKEEDIFLDSLDKNTNFSKPLPTT